LTLVAGTACAQPKLGAVGVFSLLGDGVDVTAADDKPRDTRIERTSRETLEFKNIGFDLIALKAAREAILRAQPSARVALYQAPSALSATEQRSVAQGAANAELPGWMVKTMEEGKLTHLLIITRARGTMDARTSEGFTIGRGVADGVGFYIDTLYEIQNRQTGAVSTGLLAPYTQIKLQLMDAQSGDIVSGYDIKEAFVYGSREVQVKADPWSFMPAAEKVSTLRQMVERGMDRGMKAILSKP
jgi:hypothetical protein